MPSQPRVTLTDSPVLEAKNATLRTAIEAHVAWHGDAALVLARDRLTHQRDGLRAQLARAQDVRLVTASVVGCRKSVRDGRHCAEYHIEVVTETHGTLHVWHNGAKFSSLATLLKVQDPSLPSVPGTDVRRFTEAALRERIVLLNAFLTAIVDQTKDLRWGILVHEDLRVFHSSAKARSSTLSPAQQRRVNELLADMTAERDVHDEFKWLRARLGSYTDGDTNALLAAETSRLAQEVEELQSLVAATERVSLLSARVVEGRKGPATDEYKLEVQTATRGTLYVWHRYSTYCGLRTLLVSKAKANLPPLPAPRLFSLVTDSIIADRVSKLNAFFEATQTHDEVQWGIRIDDKTTVYKHRKRSCSGDRISFASTSASSDDEA
ncbi:myosin-like protein [Achlya hypogyna]|uniref:Myosin-like protein n=1 Tax=Achlya hypogyna TaxID=1202772 RepID=A0A1V9ZDR1_ACHHY|nr:myosin-like protein [Achlya hypogyna]